MMDLVILINLNLLSNKNKKTLKPRMTILVILINNQLIKRKVQKKIAIILEISVITKTILKSLSPMVGSVILMKPNHRNQKMMVLVISMNNLFKNNKTNLKVIMALETSMTTNNLINLNLKMGSEILTIKMTLKTPLNQDNLHLI